MRSALSQPLSITLGGAGFGLIAWLGFGLGGSSAAFAAAAFVVAVGLALGGYALAGRGAGVPRSVEEARAGLRAGWRARATVIGFGALALFCLYAAPWILFGARIGLLGFATTLAAGGALYAAGMRERDAAAGPALASRMTPVTFLAFGLASGALTDAMLTDLIAHDDGGRADGAAIFLLLIAFAARLGWWERARKRGARPQGAFGLGETTLRRLVIGLGLALPIICIDLSGRFGALFVLLGLGSHLAGLLIDRRMMLDAAAPEEPEGEDIEGDSDDGAA